MALRVCLEPGCPTPTSRTRCTLHERLRQRRRGTPAERGYDGRYQRARKALLAVADLCAWCGLPPRRDDPLTADHVVPLALGAAPTAISWPRTGAATARTANVRRGSLRVADAV